MRDPDIPHSRIPHTSSTFKEKHHLMSRTAKTYVKPATNVGGGFMCAPRVPTLHTPPYPPRCSSLNLTVLLYALPAPTRSAAWSSWIVFLLLRKAVGWDGWRCIDRLALSSRHLSLDRYQSGLRESFRSQGINPLVRSPKCFLKKKKEVG